MKPRTNNKEFKSEKEYFDNLEQDILNQTIYKKQRKPFLLYASYAIAASLLILVSIHIFPFNNSDVISDSEFTSIENGLINFYLEEDSYEDTDFYEFENYFSDLE